MRPQKVQDTDMLQGLMSVLRAKGYDGASLNELAEAAGLKKASLYHRFPGGKQEMASAVLAYVGEWVEQYIYQLLIDKEQQPKQRLLLVLDNIRALYQDGDAICIFRSLSMDTGMELFGDKIKAGMERWIEAFAKLGIAFGLSPAKAKQAALQTMIDIQGSLVIAKGMSSTKIFDSALKGIQKRYLQV